MKITILALILGNIIMVSLADPWKGNMDYNEIENSVDPDTNWYNIPDFDYLSQRDDSLEKRRLFDIKTYMCDGQIYCKEKEEIPRYYEDLVFFDGVMNVTCVDCFNKKRYPVDKTSKISEQRIFRKGYKNYYKSETFPIYQGCLICKKNKILIRTAF